MNRPGFTTVNSSSAKSQLLPRNDVWPLLLKPEFARALKVELKSDFDSIAYLPALSLGHIVADTACCDKALVRTKIRGLNHSSGYAAFSNAPPDF